MSFRESYWLWGVLFAVLLLGWRWRTISQAKDRFRRFAHEGTWPLIAPELDWGSRKRRAIAWSVGLSFGFLALARPQWGLKEEVIRITGLDVIVALDVSNSMGVEDVIPNRLKKAEHAIRTLVEELGSDRVGLVAFAASTYLACPLTTDHGYVKEILQGMSPKSVVNQGTDIGLALDTAVEALARGAEQGGDRDGTRVIVLVTDGEDLEEGALEGAQKVEKSGAKLYVVGIGSDKGGPIPIRDENGSLVGYKKDGKGQPVVSRMNPQALEKIAQAANGRFFQLGHGEREIEEILRDMSGLQRSDKLERKRVTAEERFQIPLTLAVLVFFLEMAISIRRRAGASVKWAAGLFFSLQVCGTGPAHAADSIEVYLENKKGVESFKKGNVEEAREHFGRAQAEDPTRPELLFNQGVVQLEQKSMDQAVEGFSGAAQQALARKDPRLAGSAFYNLGGALEAKGDADSAIRSYLKGLEAAREAKDPQLERDLRKKIELLVQKQQQKQQSQGKNDQNQAQNEKDQQKRPDDQKDGESESGQRPDQNQQGSRAKDEKDKPGQKSFQSQKLTKEDAERVMNELSERERDLQAKMSKQKGRPDRRERDW